MIECSATADPFSPTYSDCIIGAGQSDMLPPRHPPPPGRFRVLSGPYTIGMGGSLGFAERKRCSVVAIQRMKCCQLRSPVDIRPASNYKIA